MAKQPKKDAEKKIRIEDLTNPVRQKAPLISLEEKYKRLVSWFSEHSPNPETELHYSNPYELIVAVSLSAQCTDKRVNLVTPHFFSRFPDAQSLAFAEKDEVFEYIKSISYPNNKSINLIGMAKMLAGEFNNIVPDSVDELVKLPGVGRKTANVIASVVFGQAAMAVDTHVFRVSHRMGLVADSDKTPLDVERKLVSYLPEEVIAKAHHWLILHGRYICLARKPNCSACSLTELCDYYQNGTEK